MAKNTVFIEPRSKHVSQVLARELARLGIPEDVYLSRIGGADIFEIPVGVHRMLQTDSDVRAGRDYLVIRGVDRRVRKPRPTVKQLVGRGLVTLGMKPAGSTPAR